MDFENSLKDAFSLNKLNESEYGINHSGTFLDGTPITIHLVCEGNTWYLSDKKSTLKYMNSKYELNARDVKMCILNVLKLYGFKITQGELKAKVPSEELLTDKIIEFLMCIAQLTNMYVFFDEPA